MIMAASVGEIWRLSQKVLNRKVIAKDIGKNTNIKSILQKSNNVELVFNQ